MSPNHPRDPLNALVKGTQGMDSPTTPMPKQLVQKQPSQMKTLAKTKYATKLKDKTIQM